MSFTHRSGTVGVAGGDLPYQLLLPDAGHGPGIVFCHEIFGLNQHMIHRAERLADLGYVVLAPDFFWRFGPDQAIEETEPDALQRAMAKGMQLDWDAAAADGAAALQHLRDEAEVAGGVGVAGHCMGGMIAYLIAARAEPDAAVLYYPSGVERHLEQIDDIHCPTLYEFGAEDTFMPPAVAERVRQATADREGVEVRVQPGAGHAFDNEQVPAFYRPAAMAAAWEDAQAFLRRWLPAGV